MREKRAPSTCGFVATCHFSGDDVNQAIEGLPFDMDVAIAIPYTLTDLKTALTAGAQTLGTTLGLTIATTDVDLLTLEQQGP